jgi:lactoylglutathione lyase
VRFGHVTIFVKNLEESMNFYHEFVGLPVERRFSPKPGTDIVFLGDGETKIELVYDRERTDIVYGKDISLGFEVASLGETAESLRRMGVAAGEVSRPNPRVKFFFYMR